MVSFLAGLFVGEGKFEEIRDNRKTRSKKKRPILLAELERRYRESSNF